MMGVGIGVLVDGTLALLFLQELLLFQQAVSFMLGAASPRKPSVFTARTGTCLRRGSLAARMIADTGAPQDPKRDVSKPPPPRSVLERPWDVEVELHGERHVITVQPGDSILEASGVLYKATGFSTHRLRDLSHAEMSGMNLSYDCRRGSCTSCAAKVREDSSGNFDNRADRLPAEGAPEGFVLTCSTYPVGPGVKLELSANAEMWTAFCTKFEDSETKDLLRQASAAVILDYNVRNPEEFRQEIERQFRTPPSPP